jgi:3-hydroxyacyl-[acyl-carrier-protein] dehydratase
MLKDSLYHIIALNQQDISIEATLEIDQHHAIFTGHFPGQPVLPGACMLQIVKEVLELTLDKKLQLQKADNLKFIQIIDPQINNTIQLNLKYNLVEDDKVRANAGLTSGEAVCFKFQGVFVLT